RPAFLDFSKCTHDPRPRSPRHNGSQAIQAGQDEKPSSRPCRNRQDCLGTTRSAFTPPTGLTLLTRTLGAATTRATEGAAPTAPTTIPRAIVRAVTGVELRGNQPGCWLDITGRERWLAACLRCCKLDPIW